MEGNPKTSTASTASKASAASAAAPALWTIIATARAYERAARKEFKRLITSRPDVFGGSYTTSDGEVHAFGLAEGAELPDGGRQAKARASAAAHLVAALIDHRKGLMAAIGNIVITGTSRRRIDAENSIADIIADIEEAHGIGITAKIKPYASDATVEELAGAITAARYAAEQARESHNDEHADDIVMLMDDLRQAIWSATEGRPVIRHSDAAAIAAAVKSLILAIEGD